MVVCNIFKIIETHNFFTMMQEFEKGITKVIKF